MSDKKDLQNINIKEDNKQSQNPISQSSTSVSDSVRSLQNQIKEKITPKQETPLQEEKIQTPGFDSSHYVPISSKPMNSIESDHELHEVNQSIQNNKFAYEDSYVLESMIDGTLPETKSSDTSVSDSSNSFSHTQESINTENSNVSTSLSTKDTKVNELPPSIPKQLSEKPNFYQMMKQKTLSLKDSMKTNIESIKTNRDQSQHWYNNTFHKQSKENISPSSSSTSSSTDAEIQSNHEHSKISKNQFDRQSLLTPLNRVQTRVYNALHKPLDDSHDKEDIIQEPNINDYTHNVDMMKDTLNASPVVITESQKNIPQSELIDDSTSEPLITETSNVSPSVSTTTTTIVSPKPSRMNQFLSTYKSLKEKNQLKYVYEGIGGITLLTIITLGIKKSGYTKTYRTVNSLLESNRKLPLSLHGHIYKCSNGIIPFYHIPFYKILFSKTRPDIYTYNYSDTHSNNTYLELEPYNIRMTAIGQDIMNLFISQSYGLGKVYINDVNFNDNKIYGIIHVHNNKNFILKYMDSYNLNKIILQSGYGKIENKDMSSFKYAKQYSRWQVYAQRRQLGIWEETSLDSETNILIRFYYKFIRWIRKQRKHETSTETVEDTKKLE